MPRPTTDEPAMPAALIRKNCLRFMGAFMRFPNELIFRRKPAGPLVKRLLVVIRATRMASLKGIAQRLAT
jgi:hypothetical protein